MLQDFEGKDTYSKNNRQYFGGNIYTKNNHQYFGGNIYTKNFCGSINKI